MQILRTSKIPMRVVIILAKELRDLPLSKLHGSTSLLVGEVQPFHKTKAHLKQFNKQGEKPSVVLSYWKLTKYYLQQ